MAQKRNPEQKKRIAEAALSLADKSGWGSLTFTAIARKARLKNTDVEKNFSDIWDILKFVLADLEANTRKTVENYLGDNWRDNILEILMTRFDLAEAHRGAFSSLSADIRRQPKIIRKFARTFYETMDRMLTLATFPPSPFQPLAVAGFGAVYLSVVDAWIKDDTRDKSKTMATLDKRLELFESLTGYLNCKK